MYRVFEQQILIESWVSRRGFPGSLEEQTAAVIYEKNNYSIGVVDYRYLRDKFLCNNA